MISAQEIIDALLEHDAVRRLDGPSRHKLELCLRLWAVHVTPLPVTTWRRPPQAITPPVPRRPVDEHAWEGIAI